MSVVRSSGIYVETTGPVEVASAPADSVKKRSAAAAPVRPVDGGAVVAEMQRHDLELIDAIPLRPSPAPVKRGAPSRASVALDVPLGADEDAVVLLEEEGEYRWIIDGSAAAPRSAKRSARGTAAPGAATGRRKRFDIELQPAPSSSRQASPKRVKRNWFTEKVTEKVVAYVFRFALKVAGKPLLKVLERNVAEGLVAIGSTEIADWQLLGDAAPLPRALPSSRAARVLLLVHGTFSSTVGSYGALTATKDGRDFLARALSAYDAVLGYDHRTLSVDPLENAKSMLARLRAIGWAKPPRLDIVAFSRGGLVARCMVEQLLPDSDWKILLGRMVFVGCTNGGTQLAEPKNWQRFVDHYTNFALGAVRAIALIPGAQGWTTIAGQAIRGVAALVKALATGAVTDNVVPGLAAMEPDGDFIKEINRTSPGQVSAADAKFYAITTNFQAGKAASSGSAPELPGRLLLRIADWTTDSLYREPNDLVVHVRSMSYIDPEAGDFIKTRRLDFGDSAIVYHTNYFAQPRTAQQLTTWLELPAAKAAAVKRGASRRRSPPALGKRATAPPDGDAARALALIEAFIDETSTSAPLERSIEAPSPAAYSGGVVAFDADNAGESRPDTGGDSRPDTSGDSWPDSSGSARPDDDDSDGGRGGLGGFLSHVPDSPWPASAPAPERRTRGLRAPRPITRPAPERAAPPLSRESKAECYFAAEVVSQIEVRKTVPVTVRISREEIEAALGKISAQARSEVKAAEKLIVEIAAYRNLRVIGDHRRDIEVPKAGQPLQLEFKVAAGESEGTGQLSVQFRQGSVPLATLWLLPGVVARVTGSRETLSDEAEVQKRPPIEPALDEIRIIENVSGNVVTYTFLLDLPTIRLRREFTSPPLQGTRDEYVKTLMNDIGDSWVKNSNVEAFEKDIRAIGSKMFGQLIPREMQELLWKYRDRIRSVQVFSREPFIPWELICLKNPDGVVTRRDKFLGELGLLRWLYDGFPPPLLRIRRSRVRYMIAEYADTSLDLPEGEAEGKMLEKIFGAKRIPATMRELDAVLETREAFDLLHICCHGTAAGDQASQAQVFLNGSVTDHGIDGESLKATTVEETVRLAEDGAEYRPIVVLNACESARPNREFTGMGGFAHAFVKARAGAFIGTHWSVGDAPAYAFVEALYKAFAQKREEPITLSEAVTAARAAARGKDDATWLAYVVYGHPRARVVVE